jgi:glycosyltransferase involved in cell wall biosynthesis
MKALVGRFPQLRALIVGGEDPKRKKYAQELYRRVSAEGLAEHIIFTGHRADMKEIYAISSAVLSLSTKPESFGRTVLEALSLGTPVIGYAHGGVGEILTALYPFGGCEKGDLSQVTDKLATLLQQPLQQSLQQSLQQPSQQHPVQRPRKNELFLLSTMQAQTLQLYQELLDR